MCYQGGETLSADRTAAPSPGNQGEKQVDYDIRAPDGGLRREVDDYLEGAREYLDLQISSGRGHRAEVRVFPDRQTVRRDTGRHDLVHLYAATCYQLVDGEITGSALMCSGRINTQVTSAPLETGKLNILFEEGDPL